MVRQWRGREDDLRSAREGEAQRYKIAVESGDASVAATIIGEAAGLIKSIEPAAGIVHKMVAQAEERLKIAFGMIG